MPLVHLAMKGAEKSLEKFIGRQKKITKRIETVLSSIVIRRVSLGGGGSFRR